MQENVKKDVDKEVMTRIKEFEMDIARSAKNNPKLVYQYVNSKKKVKNEIRALNNKDGVRTEVPVEIVNILNDQYQSVFEHDNGTCPPIDHISGIPFVWNDNTTVKASLVAEKLKKLNVHKAMGTDKVNANVLKNCPNRLRIPISIIFESS